MVFSNFVSQARFECLILHFIVRSSIYKCWDVIFKTQSKMAAGDDQENFQKFTCFYVQCKKKNPDFKMATVESMLYLQNWQY